MKQASIISSEILTTFLLGSVLVLSSCFSGGKMNPGERRPESKTATAMGMKSGVKDEYPATMTIIYHNKTTTVTLEVDPNDEDLFLQMSGGSVEVDSLQDPVRSVDTREKMKEDGNTELELGERKTAVATAKVLAKIRQAQEHFYRKEYEQALLSAKKSIEIEETAQGLALIGSILYVQGDREEAKRFWMKALKIDPEMPAISDMIQKLEGEN